MNGDPSMPSTATSSLTPLLLLQGDEDEGKRLSGATPAAKKGCVLLSPLACTPRVLFSRGTLCSSCRSALTEIPRRRVGGDDDVGSDSGRTGSPPPAAAPSSSRPATPPAAFAPVDPPATEGKDTKQLRERVQALKPPGQAAEGAGAGNEAARAHDVDVEIAEVAGEVSTSAAKLGDEQDKKEAKDVEIAEVAAEVGKSAQNLAKEDEREMQDVADGVGEGVSKETADVAAEVGESAAKVQAQDEKIADAASEVAEAATAAPEETPAPAPKPSTAVAPFEPKEPKPQPVSPDPFYSGSTRS